jgi:hypothetical protein
MLLFRMYGLTIDPEVNWHFPASECAQAQHLHTYRQDSGWLRKICPPLSRPMEGHFITSAEGQRPWPCHRRCVGRGAVVWL